MDNEVSHTPELENSDHRTIWEVFEDSDNAKEVMPEGHQNRERYEFIKNNYILTSYEAVAKDLGVDERKQRFEYKIPIEGVKYNENTPIEECDFLVAVEAGRKVYAIIGTNAPTKYRVDIFSPFFFNGYMGNHDANLTDILENLYKALTGPDHK